MRWQVGDATELELPAGSADVVFSNWLLMYLSDKEVAKLAGDALTWVRMQSWPDPLFCMHVMLRCSALLCGTPAIPLAYGEDVLLRRIFGLASAGSAGPDMICAPLQPCRM